ncbi:hypothetical protein [Streptomyces niveus]|uniref:hypothetical protein n=1 Tax=Streptomyces niveus TaxID=193462 RepID=UPI0033F9F5B1
MATAGVLDMENCSPYARGWSHLQRAGLVDRQVLPAPAEMGPEGAESETGRCTCSLRQQG